jgi:hypothetical protein
MSGARPCHAAGLQDINQVARRSTPLVVSDGAQVMGVIELKDIVGRHQGALSFAAHGHQDGDDHRRQCAHCAWRLQRKRV